MAVMPLLTISAGAACCEQPESYIVTEEFGRLSTGEQTHLYTLTNSSGASMAVTDYGARIVSIFVPDRNGKLGDVIVGHGDIESFENGYRFMGSILGRYGNRINHSSFTIDGIRYEVSANERLEGIPVHLSGGKEGFDKFVWEAEEIVKADRLGIRFRRLSPDGEQGYPGNCDCSVTYWWDEDNTCTIVYQATTDKPTVINLSNHAYFNLKGEEGGYVMDHQLTVYADSFIQNNLQYCPDKILPVEDSPFDFREPHRVDYRIDMPNEHLRIMKGMSACWKLRYFKGNRTGAKQGCIDSTATLIRAADLYEPGSGRSLETWTTEPFILTYTGRGFDGSLKGKYGPLEKFSGMLLETIHAPDSPNQKKFPTTVLRPGERYSSITEYRFSAK